jgi:hypothetical protein
MVKWLITRVRAKRGWEIVNFTGLQGGESTGIVDLLAIRKDHRVVGFPGGDWFEMILIQVKGGSARWPNGSDILRLRAVADRYRARDVVLAEHKSGSQPMFFRLKRTTPQITTPEAWVETDATALLGKRSTLPSLGGV